MKLTIFILATPYVWHMFCEALVNKHLAEGESWKKIENSASEIVFVAAIYTLMFWTLYFI